MLPISHTDERLPNSLPSIAEIFHWDLNVGDLHHAASASDLERMVNGKLTIEGFQEYTEGGRLTPLSSTSRAAVPTRLDGALEPISK